MLVLPLFLTLFFAGTVFGCYRRSLPFMRAVMLLVMEAAIDGCVKRCDGIVAVTLSVF